MTSNLMNNIINTHSNFNFPLYTLDAARPYQLGFQDPITPAMEGIIYFHNNVMTIIVFISLFVTYFIYKSLHLYMAAVHLKANRGMSSHLLEIVWTIGPAAILLTVGFDSTSLLFSLEELTLFVSTIKIIGHQWFWSYSMDLTNLIDNTSTLEYTVFSKHYANTKNEYNFDSYMTPTKELVEGQLRLLEVDHRATLPVNTNIRCLITSDDVLHSWALPSAGIKVDACPGRINSVVVFFKRLSTVYGQCSELCGIGHGFMPIVVDVIDQINFLDYVASVDIQNNTISQELVA